MQELTAASHLLQQIYNNLCRARDNSNSAAVETVLDQVIEMIVRTANETSIPLDLQNRLIASIQTVDGRG